MDLDSLSSKIDKLNATNFHAWKQKIKHLLALKDLSEFIDPDASFDDTTEWRKKDIKAQAIIGLTLSDELLENVREVTTTSEMWKTICDVFERHTLLNKLSARRKFYTATKEEGESALQFANRIRQLAATLKSMNVTIEDSEMAMAMLNGLPEAYDPLISALDAISGEDDDLKFDYVKSRVIQEEQRIDIRTGQAAAKAETAALLSQQASNKKKPVCTHCHKPGHTEAKCWKKHPHLNPHKKDKQETAFVATGSPEEDNHVVCLVAKHSQYATQAKAKSEIDWVIDSGCSNHMTYDKSLFTSYSVIRELQYVELGNSNKARIMGKGTVQIQITVNGKSRTCLLMETMHVPDLGYNLVSVPTLDKKKMNTTFGEHQCLIKNREGVIMATGTMLGNLYKLDVDASQASKNTALVAQDLSTWHERLAHIDSATIKKMSSDGSVTGIHLTRCGHETHNCDQCVVGKGHRQPFPKESASRSSKVLELVHSDVVGPLETPSHGGSRYFVTFIDDYSKWTTVYMMKKKSETFNCFIKYHKMAETHTGTKLKVLRTDNGGEYLSNAFKSYLDQHGVMHQTTIAYTPQQNGVAERMNRTLVDLVRSMLHAKNMDKKFWAEALQTAVYIRNRVASRALPRRTTPHLRWNGSTPDLSHCRVFGAKCFYVLPKNKVKKLDPRSREGIFVGYLERSKGYKLWDPQTRSCIMSRDVTFREESEPSSPSITVEVQDKPQLDTSNRGGDKKVRFESVDEVIPPNKPVEDISAPAEVDNEITIPVEDTEEEEEAEPQPQLRRSSRQRKKPSEWWKSSANTALSARVVPVSYKAAMDPSNIDFWTPGITKEHDCLLRNKTWTLVKREPDMHVLPSKYVFRVKNGGPKARLVALGCRQLHGVDYLETFAPVVKLTTIRTMLALAATHDLECEQMDVTTAFLNGDLDEDIYMQIPEGLRNAQNEGMVCKLQKSLYGLKQAPRQWYAKIHHYLVQDLKFLGSPNDPCLYVRKSSEGLLIIALYVDDLLIVGDSKTEIATLKGELSKRFEMKDLGSASTMLGVEITRDRPNRKLWITQQEYTAEILKRFRMEETRSVSTPMDKSTLTELDTSGEQAPEGTPYRQAIGSLIYLVSCTRPDLAFTVRRLSQYLEKPKQKHWTAVRRALRYLWCTRDSGIIYDGNLGTNIVGYSDSDYAGCTIQRKSTSGYVFLLAGGAISWKSKKQSVVATSSCEAEYIASCMAAKEAIWLSRLVADLRQQEKPDTVSILVDNNGAKDLALNATVNERTKHIDIQYHFVRQCNQDGKIKLLRCDTTDQLADPLTKPLDKFQHQKLCKMQGLQSHKLPNC